MTVLVKLMQEREQWAAAHRANQIRRNIVTLLGYGVLLAMGLLVVGHYQTILATVMGLLHL